MSTTWYHPVATLGWIAGQTTRVRLMTNVYVAAYRHPLETAKAFATLDHLSGGRVILGVGAGHVEGEFAALGIPFAERGRITDAAIDGILEAWTDEYVGDVGLRPRPAARPRPPIWIGGSSKPALRRVAARGDGWIPQGTPKKEMPAAIAFIEAERDRVRPGADVRHRRDHRDALRRRRRLGAAAVHAVGIAGADRRRAEPVRRDGRVAPPAAVRGTVGRRAVRPDRRLRRRGRPAPEHGSRNALPDDASRLPGPGGRLVDRRPRSTRPRWTSSAGPTRTASTSRSCRSTTGSATAGCRRRSPRRPRSWARPSASRCSCPRCSSRCTTRSASPSSSWCSTT